MESFKILLKTVVRHILIGIVLVVVSFVTIGAYPLACVLAAVLAIGKMPYEVEGTASALVTLGLFVGPFVNGFWMALLCRWYPIRKAQREGRLGRYVQERTMRDLWDRNMEATKFMLFGFFGSPLAQGAFFLAVKFMLVPTLPTALALPLLFIMLPIAVFAPIIILVYRRRNYFKRQVPGPDANTYNNRKRKQREAGTDFLKNLGVTNA